MIQEKEIERLKEGGFFRESPLHAHGYKERVPGTSILVRTSSGKQVVITGLFEKDAPVHRGLVQYYDGRKLCCLPPGKLSLVEAKPQPKKRVRKNGGSSAAKN